MILLILRLKSFYENCFVLLSYDVIKSFYLYILKKSQIFSNSIAFVGANRKKRVVLAQRCSFYRGIIYLPREILLILHTPKGIHKFDKT